MTEHFNITTFVFLVTCVAITWFAARYIGTLGMILSHFVNLVGYFALTVLAMDAGRYQYEGIDSMIGLLLQVFVMNCLLLPVAGVALWRRRRAANPASGLSAPVSKQLQ